MAKKLKSSQEVSIETAKAVSPQPVWSADQIQLIKNTVARGATDDELKLFLYTASRTGLDPLTKQIFFVKRWDSKMGKEVGAIQTGIDGYRAIAERTGQLAGIDDAVYEEQSGTGVPFKATVSVYRIVKNLRVAFTASARWSEYGPTQAKGAFMWSKMPYLMLGKVAEALALRKAFPLNLSGVYTSEEMAQADNTAIIDTKTQPKAVLPQPEAYPDGEEVIDITPEPVKIEKPKISDLSKITHLVKLLKLTEPIEEKIKAVTGLVFVPDNYPEIVTRLETVYKESKENK